MVQSIFDEDPEGDAPAKPRLTAREEFGLGLFSDAPQPAAPQPPPEVQPPPATQLDGTDRVNTQPAPPQNLYDQPASRTDLESENIRRSGLAWSAGVVFFGTVAFMLFIGWGADLLLGSRPWGLVLGIVLGSVIAFIQFFRISSQIYSQPHRDLPKVNPIMSPPDEDRYDE
jgi:F0F1-type ATP synthase assembly protein I